MDNIISYPNIVDKTQECTVGRNPAPVEVGSLSKFIPFTKFYTSQVVSRISSINSNNFVPKENFDPSDHSQFALGSWNCQRDKLHPCLETARKTKWSPHQARCQQKKNNNKLLPG